MLPIERERQQQLAPLSYRNIWYCLFLLERKIITLEFRYIESDNSPSARTVQLAKP